MEEKTLQEIQETLFSLSAQKSSEELPGRLTLTVGTNECALKDVASLKEKGLLTWDFSMKSNKSMTPVSNPEHMLSCVAYYDDIESNYYCIGYALGCISADNSAIEIDFIEKRPDTGIELKSKFLPIVIDAFTTYGLYLNDKKVANINKIMLLSPVTGVQEYYIKQGSKYINYYRGTPAMIMLLQ